MFPLRRSLPLALLATALLSPAGAQPTPPNAPFVYGDPLPDAPELAPRGPYAVGVRTLHLLHRDQLDVLKVSPQNPNPRYDRPLTLEVWYPAQAGAAQSTSYSDVLGSGPNDPKRPNTPFTFAGRAARDAQPDRRGGPYPLVIVSHGYPGSRLLMTYLTENLASKGYVVVAIDHTDSTHADKAGFASTLLNRPLDDLFVLDSLASTGARGSGDLLEGVVDADRTALVGYSMGGYGALNVAGAGFDQQLVQSPLVPGGALAVRAAGNPVYQKSLDPRIKAVVAFAPWGGDYALKSIGVNFGGPFGFWDAAGLAGLKTPTLFVVGDHDDVAGYQGGVKSLFENAVNADRYMLVYQNARHNAAPNPAPPAAQGSFDDFMHYAEPAWNTARLNNLNQHFVTAFLGTYLKGDDKLKDYLNVVPKADEGKWSQNKDGTLGPDHTYWKGFKNRTALGMELYHLTPAK